jgi:hypothetical protein
MGSTPKTPETSAAQTAFDIEQRRALDDEVKAENRRRKALSRGQLGGATLLSGLPSTSSAAVSKGGGAVLDGGSTPTVKNMGKG